MPSDVRRSARGAPPPTTKPPPPASTASSSSLSSSRQDRNTRLNNTQKSTTPHSLSSEETSEPPRRSQRAHQSKEEEAVKDSIDAGEDLAEEEEVTRCICGQQEYPGPPLSEAFDDVDAQPEDAGGLFISCDGCSVWQHGGCVGIIEESQVPDKYFCDECRPKLHQLHTDSRGYVTSFPTSPFLPTCSFRLLSRAFQATQRAACGKRRLQQASHLCHLSLPAACAALTISEITLHCTILCKTHPISHSKSTQWRVTTTLLPEQLLSKPNTVRSTRFTSQSMAKRTARLR